MASAYVSVADVRQALGAGQLIKLSNDAPSADAPDEAVIDMAVDAASQLVDGYLRARHVLPLNPVPTVIRDLTLTLVCYRLYARRMASGVPETVKDQRDHAIKTLEHIQSGRITLGDAATHQAVPEAGAMRVRAPQRQFGEDTLAQWRM